MGDNTGSFFALHEQMLGNLVMAEIQAQGSDRSPANNFDTTSHLAATSNEVDDNRLFMPIVATA